MTIKCLKGPLIKTIKSLEGPLIKTSKSLNGPLQKKHSNIYRTPDKDNQIFET